MFDQLDATPSLAEFQIGQADTGGGVTLVSLVAHLTRDRMSFDSKIKSLSWFGKV